MGDNECVFCDIVSKKLDSYLISQNEYTTTFLDINPITYGHILVIPNQHYDKLNQIEDNEISKELMHSIINTSNRLIKADICSDYSIHQDNGEYAEQDIKHVHFHIIPRYINDGVNIRFETNSVARQETNLMKIYKKIVTKF